MVTAQQSPLGIKGVFGFSDGKKLSASATWVAGHMASEGKIEQQMAQEFITMSLPLPRVGGMQMKRWLQVCPSCLLHTTHPMASFSEAPKAVATFEKH